jgi:hypothetical protein
MQRFLAGLALFLPLAAYGVTYKCFDAQGRVTYTEVKESGKRCVEATLPQVQVVPAQATPRRETEEGARPSGAGGQVPETAAKNPEQDLAAAKKALEEARRKLAEQEAVRYGDEKNYQRVLDRLKPYQDEVAKAEARVRELGGTP